MDARQNWLEFFELSDGQIVLVLVGGILLIVGSLIAIVKTCLQGIHVGFATEVDYTRPLGSRGGGPGRAPVHFQLALPLATLAVGTFLAMSAWRCLRAEDQ